MNRLKFFLFLIFFTSGGILHAQQNNMSVGAPNPISPSFDCNQATGRVEKMICSSPEISTLDRDLANTYKQALKESKNPGQMRVDQIAWIQHRSACKTLDCLKASYETRLTSLKTSPAAKAQKQN